MLPLKLSKEVYYFCKKILLNTERQPVTIVVTSMLRSILYFACGRDCRFQQNSEFLFYAFIDIFAFSTTIFRLNRKGKESIIREKNRAFPIFIIETII